MNATVLVVVGLSAITLGYLFYSKFLATRIFQLAEDFETPAHEFEDGVGLRSHEQVRAVGPPLRCGCWRGAPIVGPAIAVIWGWLPAFLWVILGTVFFAGIHDFRCALGQRAPSGQVNRCPDGGDRRDARPGTSS